MTDTPATSRRRFLKTFTLLTASSSLLARRWTQTVVAQVLPKGGVLRIRLSDFPSLQNDYGSVRIGTNPVIAAPSPMAPLCRKPANTIPSLYPILINRAPGNQFHALSAECSHEGCVVARLQPAGPTGDLFCAGHGSRYRIDGSVIPDTGPSNSNLVRYDVEFEEPDTLKIVLPDLFFELSTTGVEPGGSGRFRLNFLATSSLTYEIRFRQALDGESQAVPFSLTPDGPLQSETSGNDDYVTVYVERQSAAGFYSIVMKISEV